MITDLAGGALVIYDFSGVQGQAVLSGVTAAQLLAASFIEAVGSPATPVITGTAGNDLLLGSPGSDDIRGLAGNDVIVGNGGADTLNGGTGDDKLFTADAGDVVVEAAGEGYDRVYTSVSRTLEANVEAGAALGGAAVDITGNGLGNWLSGNGGVNVLAGGAGNDRLIGLGGNDNINGGTGNDMLQGGADADRFVFRTGDGGDRILDFERGTDLIDLSGTGLAFANLTISDLGTGALIQYGTDTIVADGITAAQLTQDQFDFTF